MDHYRFMSKLVSPRLVFFKINMLKDHVKRVSKNELFPRNKKIIFSTIRKKSRRKPKSGK